jgi:tryptophan-rich sensory protein
VVGRYAAVMSSREREDAADDDEGGWYERLDKPAYTPPPLAFSVVWPVLYVLMGVATFVAYTWGGRPLWIVYGALFFNLAFNLAFPLVQFRLRDLFWASVIVWATLFTALLLMYAVTVKSATAKAETASLILLLPYVLWLIFATLLSTDIYIRNR